MKRTWEEQQADMRKALDMLERAKRGGATTSKGDGPVEPEFAIGWAKSCLQRALGLPDA